VNNIIKRKENKESRIQCMNCKRVLEYTKNDEYRCEYGLTSVVDNIRPKCKYFKRNPKYIKYNGIRKIGEQWCKGYIIKVGYIRGKFKYTKIEK
jgi:hypothetical protein